MTRGSRVLVGLCDYTDTPKRWVPGTIVAIRGCSAVVDLDVGWEWWGSTMYLKPL